MYMYIRLVLTEILSLDLKISVGHMIIGIKRGDKWEIFCLLVFWSCWLMMAKSDQYFLEGLVLGMRQQLFYLYNTFLLHIFVGTEYSNHRGPNIPLLNQCVLKIISTNLLAYQQKQQNFKLIIKILQLIH